MKKSATRKPKGVIAAGHPATAEAASEILRDGGNAFDAIVAAQFAAFVAEPVLTSLGGGGFLMAKPHNEKAVLYDFFVDTPSQKRAEADLQFYPISADFGEARQEYYVGAGSVAVPGMVKGLFRIHKEQCTMPLKRLAEPAIELASGGVLMNAFQSGVLDIIKPIYSSSKEARGIFKSITNGEDLIREGEKLKQPELAKTISELAAQGEALFYGGEISQTICAHCRENGGHLTGADFKNYRVIKRAPLEISYNQNKIYLNPPPSSGGILIAFALKVLESGNGALPVHGSADMINLLAGVQKLTNKARVDAFVSGPVRNPAQTLLDPEYLDLYKKEIRNNTSFLRGTTQISIADGSGNVASMTTSNGEGSGVMIPGTGVMLNNMLGEKDLNPGGFHTWEPAKRVTSMMTPGLMEMNDGSRIVFGSGGSNRIRTAILQVLLNLTESGFTLKEAVDAPRVHFEEGELNVEGGYDKAELEKISAVFPRLKIWGKKHLYFGGAHIVSSGPGGFAGAGDERRGGVCRIVD